MTDYEVYMSQVLAQTSEKLSQFNGNQAEIIADIASRAKGSLVLPQEDQFLLGGLLGSMLHQQYCDGRRRETPTENGLPNEPRIKVLTNPMDAEFANKVLSGEIPQSATVYTVGTVVHMDIANTPFEQLSPYWQKDNFGAGMCAARSILSNWEGLTHSDPTVRKFVTVSVANGIHESWIGRGNVGEWNANLDTAYINLPVDEQAKDLTHFTMAEGLIGALVQQMEQVEGATPTLPKAQADGTIPPITAPTETPTEA